jgi:hypothetical protein
MDTPDFLPDDAQLAEVLREIDFDTTEGLAELQQQYRQASDGLSPQQYAQASGISPAAFADSATLAYQPSKTYPSHLRLGELNPLLSTELNEKLGMIPYYHDFAQIPNLLLETADRTAGNVVLQNIALRVLASLDAALITLYCVDAAELGRAFSNLTTVSERLRPQRVLTETQDIEQMLRDVKAHTVNLLQGSLANRFDSLQAYNAAAGEMAEPYRFLFIANFPYGFSQQAIENLLSLLDNAALAGLAVFMSLDHAALDKHRDLADKLQQHPHLSILAQGKVSRIEGADFLNQHFTIQLEQAVSPAAESIIQAANQQAQQASTRAIRVEMPEHPFTQSSRDGIYIPVGLAGKDKTCAVRLGADDSPHHGLIGGTAGSGKSVLLHNIILNGAWLYAPDELEFLLLDYREGVEFKPYQDLPHVRVLATESSREFGLNVFEYLQQEMTRRGDLFKAAGVGKLAEYRQQTGEPLPRLLLVIDEFQVLLKGNDSISRQVAGLLDDVARRGRGFGIHLLLSTQSLMQVEIQESTLSNTKLRIGLQMAENDATKVFHRDNTAAAGLRKTGDAYLNEAHGQRDGNVRLQVAWLAPDERQARIQHLALVAGKRDTPRYIFAGAGYAALAGSPLPAALSRPAKIQARFADALIARPAYISDAPELVRLRRQAASNILMVGENEAEACGLALLMLHQYLRQSTPNSAIGIVNLLAVDSPSYDYLHVLHEQYPEQVSVLDNTQLESILERLEATLTERIQDGSNHADRIILCIMNLQNAQCCKRTGNSLSVPPATKRLEYLIHEGAQRGIHILLYSQRYQGFHETFQNPTATLGDFENRIALFGGNSEKLLSSVHTPVQQTGSADILSPQARYGIDPAYLYHPDDILNLFADLSSQGA